MTDAETPKVDMTPEQKKLSWRSSPRELLTAVLSLQDSPHHIALGFAIGMFVGMTPTVGVQMIIVMCIAVLTKPFFYFNRVAGIIAVYVSNPLTLVPIYYFLYWVGTFFVPGDVTQDEFAKVLEYESFAEWWDTVVALFVGIGTPLLIGTAIVATVSGLITYPLTVRGVTNFRRKKAERLARKQSQAANASSADAG